MYTGQMRCQLSHWTDQTRGSSSCHRIRVSVSNVTESHACQMTQYKKARCGVADSRNVAGGLTICLTVLVAVFGCASSGKPLTDIQVAETEAIIRSAESAGAFERAPDLLYKARQALGAVQQASGKGDHVVARERLLETMTYAEAARAQAQAEQQKNQADKLRQQADVIEQRANALQRQLQGP